MNWQGKLFCIDQELKKERDTVWHDVTEKFSKSSSHLDQCSSEPVGRSLSDLDISLLTWPFSIIQVIYRSRVWFHQGRPVKFALLGGKNASLLLCCEIQPNIKMSACEMILLMLIKGCHLTII